MGKRPRNKILSGKFYSPAKTATVTYDPDAGAAYVRLMKGRSNLTLADHHKHPLVAVDFDRDKEVLGVEVLSAKRLTISHLLALGNVKAPKLNHQRVEYLIIKKRLR